MTITDPELLMSVMEAREEVEEAGSDRAALQPLLERMQALEASCVQVRCGGAGWRPTLRPIMCLPAEQPLRVTCTLCFR